MPAPRHREDVEPPRTPGLHGPSMVRAALTLAFLRQFANGEQVVPGQLGFDGAPGIACLCLVAAAYLYFAGESAGPRFPIPPRFWTRPSGWRRRGRPAGDRVLNEALR